MLTRRRYTEFETALGLHEKASDELTSIYGADDLDAMIAKDSLAMTLLQIGGLARIERAQVLMQDIFDRRQRRLGQEHVYTLWAACNLARTMTARGALENDNEFIQEAKIIFNDALEITKRNLGINHIGTLMGRSSLANALVAEKRYTEAEEEHKDIAGRQKNVPGARAGTHRDRLITLQSLVRCYEVQGRLEEGVRICDMILYELDALGGQKHPWRQQIAGKREELLEGMGISTGEDSNSSQD